MANILRLNVLVPTADTRVLFISFFFQCQLSTYFISAYMKSGSKSPVQNITWRYFICRTVVNSERLLIKHLLYVALGLSASFIANRNVKVVRIVGYHHFCHLSAAESSIPSRSEQIETAVRNAGAFCECGGGRGGDSSDLLNVTVLICPKQSSPSPR
jgi:hypothetical protein